MDNRVGPAGSSGALSCSRAARPRSRGGRSDPAPGVAEHVATLDDDLAAGVRRPADGLELPLHSVALAAHAEVLAALSGEQDVVTGYAAGPGGRPLPCPPTTEARSWRSLLQDSARVESDLLQHRDFAVDELKPELGVAGPAFEWRVALGGEARDRPDRTVSLKDITEHPILADMAELLHREHTPELLTSSSGGN